MSRPGRLPFGLFEEGMVVARLAPQGIRLFAGTTSMGIFRTICRRLEQHSGDDGCGAVHVFHMREPLRKELQTNPCREMRAGGPCLPQTGISSVKGSCRGAARMKKRTWRTGIQTASLRFFCGRHAGRARRSSPKDAGGACRCAVHRTRLSPYAESWPRP